MRLLVLLIFVLTLAATPAAAQPAPPAPAPAAGEALFVVSGRGWGHGVGMSQYGAYGMANAGHTHEEILKHYYTGVEIGKAGTKVVRVLLGEGRQALVVSSAVAFTMVDGAGTVYRFPKGPLTVRPDLMVPTPTGQAKAVSPLVFRPGKKATLTSDGNLYRGKLEAALQAGFLRVVNVLPLESYLGGVVANEMPHTWPAEALQAQAVAARTYALASLVKGKPFDLYSDVRSQVYEGVAGEQPRTSDAVRATAGEVVLYAGQIATTFYFSSSGGRTSSAADVFGTAVPYLVSRPDPWDKASPNHRWGPVLFGARTLQSKLGVSTRVLDAVGVPTPSGRLRSLNLQTASGSVKVPASLLRTSLGLRSTWVTIGVLRLDPPREAVVSGTRVRLTGIARGLPEPVLASSVSGALWTPVGPLQRQTSGVASIVVKPERTMRYRIEVKGAASPALLVRVAPQARRAPPTSSTRVAIGLERDADAAAVAAAVERRTGSRPEGLAPIPALVVDVPQGVSLNGIRGVRYVERLVVRRLALTPTDPLVSRQWYLTQSRFYEPWLTLPALGRVTVAVVDSGVDASHPELAGRILDAKSFVGGPARIDPLGHGTFVAGIIAAGVDNGIGIAGLAPAADLLVAKVVTPSRSIPVEAEARAIRWAVDNGAQVINMSLGAVRDPLDPNRDSFSRLEADAVAYAVSNRVVVVAAVGNADQAPSSPWQYASYPAALPHVLGVSAINDAGAVPKFSNRDRVYNDISAPGHRILSIFPRPLTARFPACSEQGYSSCGPDEYREAQGTSFAAPQVSAAAAVLLGLRPDLRPEQVTEILERTAVDVDSTTGCAMCVTGRDELSGWGRLDVVAALAALDEELPLRDRYEANDDAGSRAQGLAGRNRLVNATVDFWDDQDDVYAIRLRARQRVYVGLRGSDQSADLSLALWLPRTRSIENVSSLRFRAKVSARGGAREYFSYRAPSTGSYFVQVRMSSPGLTRYRLRIVKG